MRTVIQCGKAPGWRHRHEKSMSTKLVIPSLTGLRGVAAMLVVFHHYSIWCAPFSGTSRPEWLWAVFATDRLGMTCFFVLSGFVIAYNYLDFGWRQQPLKSTAHFVFLRFSRLYPALLVFIGLLVMVRWTSPPYTNGLGLWTAVHLVSAQSWLPFKLNGALPDSNMFHVSWSISTEFMLYFMFAIFMVLLAVLIRAWGTRGAAVLFGLLGLYIIALIHLATAYPSFAALVEILQAVVDLPSPFEPLTEADWQRWFFYLSPYFRVIEFTLGIAAALLVMKGRVVLIEHRRAFRLLATVGLLGLFVWYAIPLTLANDQQPARVYQYVVPPACFALILANSNDDDSLINRLLSSTPLIFVGEISYSLYLFHPLSPRIGIAWPDRAFEVGLLPVLALNMAVTVGCAIVFAFGMYKLVEMPAQRQLRLLWTRLYGRRSGAAVVTVAGQ
jgi:peptidoglycan/LPS O-acetylase OafA/YrhL